MIVRAGTLVELVGLRQRPELNGRVATVVERTKSQAPTPSDAERLPVVLSGHTKPILVRPVNLRRAIAQQ